MSSAERSPDLDLSGLERVAGWLGLPQVRARVVPPGRRSDPWFRRVGDELMISERVVERLSPADAEVLLVDVLLRDRAVARLSILLVAGGLAAGLACLLVLVVAPAAFLPVAILLVLGWGAAAAIGWSRAALAADDETVRKTGDPDTLVRSLNLMNQDELHLGSWRLKARGDVHRRAERLVALHQLRLPPERRTVAPVTASEAWQAATSRQTADATGCAEPTEAASAAGSRSGAASAGTPDAETRRG